jgi:ppGpp synthetase/RelA/SpoT-type nucleotidyltranferase
MNDLEAARVRWLGDCNRYEDFGRLVATRIGTAVQQEGVWCDTTSRAKDLHSLIKKLMKGKHTYDTLPDKAGARCVVRYLSETEIVVTLARSIFDCEEEDRKLDELGFERLGYLSTHLSVRLRPADPDVVHYNGYRAELQIKTLSQHLWSEMSHDSVYKNDDELRFLPVALRRRVYLMAGLIEVADQEFDRLNDELPLSSAATLYKAMERHYFRLTTRRPDTELSLQIIDLLLPLYGDDVQRIPERLDAFFAAHEETLQWVYAHGEERKAGPLLYQPEALMIYERLESDQHAIRKLWNTRFPEGELERLANSLGISFD